ncbi:hypothetical protein EPA93_12110 [Ktedonosporobacter rubrisoli]|uniref:MOSC domain-containing protein n=1 Tax=Ktedonosporobacter rubrisoli TaxID=2509675 RepID=A0A4P6JN31_KTERU|nr:hypothetical protein [Ktedonosporobacter rubrisoli]QBD76707.1 hypothetical protein EPA93_12110 [Ktedonosporobacter rubrisoli]
MREIGQIIRVQIQPLPIKHGHPQRYDPARLLVVDRLCLTSKGVVGITSADEEVMDVHHAQHSQSRYRGNNAISIGFTSHYDILRAQFGKHMFDGCAGENILIQTGAYYTLADLGQALAIQNAYTGEFVYLTQPAATEPCVLFCRFALHPWLPHPRDQIKRTLQFLRHGRRGFYAHVAPTTGQEVIGPGDRVYVLENDELLQAGVEKERLKKHPVPS